MAAAVDGIRVVRVVSMADMRLGREGKVGTAVLFLVDGDGPFGFEVDRAAFRPGEVLARMRAVAAEVRALRAGRAP
ncbi:MAG: hypothetical protein AUI52_05415 [Acidobacteria bacterium 13_1_40CM_2_68_10]|nr:MAG: hypothetical protein AUI52_05415 [Acidobacteria bacterium 13_1_40CM_2_68_10]